MKYICASELINFNLSGRVLYSYIEVICKADPHSRASPTTFVFSAGSRQNKMDEDTTEIAGAADFVFRFIKTRLENILTSFPFHCTCQNRVIPPSQKKNLCWLQLWKKSYYSIIIMLDTTSQTRKWTIVLTFRKKVLIANELMFWTWTEQNSYCLMHSCSIQILAWLQMNCSNIFRQYAATVLHVFQIWKAVDYSNVNGNIGTSAILNHCFQCFFFFIPFYTAIVVSCLCWEFFAYHFWPKCATPQWFHEDTPILVTLEMLNSIRLTQILFLFEVWTLTLSSAGWRTTRVLVVGDEMGTGGIPGCCWTLTYMQNGIHQLCLTEAYHSHTLKIDASPSPVLCSSVWSQLSVLTASHGALESSASAGFN